MKKIVISLMLLLFCINYAEAQTTSIHLILKGTQSGPKTPNHGNDLVILSAEYDSSDLYFFIGGYTGEVDLFVTNSQNTSMDSDILNVVASANTSFDISAYPAGTYHLYIYLDDGSIYEGEFEIE